MRLKLGRPDIGGYRDRFDVPAASPDSELTVMWLGVSTMLVRDGATALLTDGFFSRPGLVEVGLGRAQSDEHPFQASGFRPRRGERGGRVGIF